jgi:hypothetical protein
MLKVLGHVTAFALLLSVGAAAAAEATGKIQSIDMTTRALVLEDGTTLSVAEGIEIDTLQPGDEVKVVYEEGADGENVATDLAVMR